MPIAPAGLAASMVSISPLESAAAPVDALDALDSLDELQLLVLKRLLVVGSNGMVQQNLFNRLPPRSTSVRIKAMRALEALGLVERRTTTRHTQRWATLWTITQAGKDEHQRRVLTIAATPAASQLTPRQRAAL